MRFISPKIYNKFILHLNPRSCLSSKVGGSAMVFPSSRSVLRTWARSRRRCLEGLRSMALGRNSLSEIIAPLLLGRRSEGDASRRRMRVGRSKGDASLRRMRVGHRDKRKIVQAQIGQRFAVGSVGGVGISSGRALPSQKFRKTVCIEALVLALFIARNSFVLGENLFFPLVENAQKLNSHRLLLCGPSWPLNWRKHKNVKRALLRGENSA